jgi:predicted ArsR family transcriptional regulator
MPLEQLFRIEDIAATREGHPDTSHEAADAATAHVWASQDATLAILAMTRHPMTALQLETVAAGLRLRFSAARMRSTLPELEEKGLVRREGYSKPPKGRRRTLWTLT